MGHSVKKVVGKVTSKIPGMKQLGGAAGLATGNVMAGLAGSAARDYAKHESTKERADAQYREDQSLLSKEGALSAGADEAFKKAEEAKKRRQGLGAAVGTKDSTLG